jgi:hypothetical protein
MMCQSTTGPGRSGRRSRTPITPKSPLERLGLGVGSMMALCLRQAEPILWSTGSIVFSIQISSGKHMRAPVGDRSGAEQRVQTRVRSKATCPASSFSPPNEKSRGVYIFIKMKQLIIHAATTVDKSRSRVSISCVSRAGGSWQGGGHHQHHSPNAVQKVARFDILSRNTATSHGDMIHARVAR